MGYRLTCPVDNNCDHAIGVMRDGSSAKRNFCDMDGKERVIPFYSSYAGNDYEVLVHVRETWKPEERMSFEVALQRITSEKFGAISGITFRRSSYEPGDYSKAALAVMEAM
jgi:hypothetical protein